MGKIIYEPKKKITNEVVEEVKKEQPINQQEDERYNALIENIDSVKPVGDTDCDYTIYLEDYVYTYMYQYASIDLACEHSAAILGQYYPENHEIIICGIMPIQKDKLAQPEEWVNEEALEALYIEKEKYFPGTLVLGWLHMQPGYGTMLTMKEVKVHRDLFNRQQSLLLLVDPINKIETFYVYEGEQLIEQTGYYIYYDKNASMQQYMLDKPFISTDKDDVDDSVVTQFREIGRMRKREYQQRKKANFTVIAASVVLLAMTAVIIRMGNQNEEINYSKQQVESLTEQLKNMQNSLTLDDTAPTLTVEGVKDVLPEQEVEIIGQETVEEVIDTEEDPDLEVISVPKQEKEDEDEGEDEGQGDAEVDIAVKDQEVQVEVSKNTEVDADEDKVQEINQQEGTDELAEQEYRSYIVQPGDSLRSISYDHFQTESRTKDIIKLNNIENGDMIYVGEEIKLPIQ